MLRVPRLVRDELRGGGIIDWYLLKDKTIIIRYGYFEILFLLPKFIMKQVYYLEMGRKMVAIKSKMDMGVISIPLLNYRP